MSEEIDRFEEGRQAFMDGLALSECPYEGDEAAEWEGGWMEAEEDDSEWEEVHD